MLLGATMLRVWRTTLSLNDWKRAFVLDPMLKPCRDSVLEFDYVRTLMTSAWFIPNYVLADESTYAFNRQAVREFLDRLMLQPDLGSQKRAEFQRHRFSDRVSLRQAVEQLLTLYRVRDPIDSQRLIGVLVQVAAILENGKDETCSVYEMSSGKPRERGINDEGRITTNLFQGAAPSTPKDQQGSIYPGDFNVHAVDAVTIQIHNVVPTKSDKPVIDAVPIIAIWIPPRLAKPWLIQNQPAQANG